MDSLGAQLVGPDDGPRRSTLSSIAKALWRTKIVSSLLELPYKVIAIGVRFVVSGSLRLDILVTNLHHNFLHNVVPVI
eukprot:SAG11_NODE_364_length_10159_cov_8.232604_6_plen_78_part_00